MTPLEYEYLRKLRRLARACNIIGRTASRRFSNGSLSRKKNVSLVVMASTTSEINGSDPLFIF